jgi:ribosomal protein L37AE/L43A
MLLTLEQIIALPDASGKHTCECGHPEMRRLPDGTFHCPSCGAEVLPVEAISGPSYR